MSPVFTPAGPNTTRPSAQVSPYNASLTPLQTTASLQSVINVDEGTSSRGLEKQSILGSVLSYISLSLTAL